MSESLLKLESITFHHIIISNFYQRKTHIVNLDSSQIVGEILVNTPAITCLILYGTDRVILGVEDMSIQIWDLFLDECLRIMLGNTHWTRCLRLLDNGRHLASGSNDTTIKIWDLLKKENDECVQTLMGHTGSVLCLDESSHLNLILTGSNDSTIRVWDKEKVLKGFNLI